MTPHHFLTCGIRGGSNGLHAVCVWYLHKKITFIVGLFQTSKAMTIMPKQHDMEVVKQAASRCLVGEFHTVRLHGFTGEGFLMQVAWWESKGPSLYLPVSVDISALCEDMIPLSWLLRTWLFIYFCIIRPIRFTYHAQYRKSLIHCRGSVSKVEIKIFAMNTSRFCNFFRSIIPIFTSSSFHVRVPSHICLEEGM